MQRLPRGSLLTAQVKWHGEARHRPPLHQRALSPEEGLSTEIGVFLPERGVSQCEYLAIMAQAQYGVYAIFKDCVWEVEFTDEFEAWWHTLSESEQGKVDARVCLLMERGANLGFPFSSQVQTSRFPEMRELRDFISSNRPGRG